mmetsp:Transcript_26037/g.72780  ORF Transcript_26037/g.72780 Transcript_26037/m.72780 type:complete len:233 (+) Transcript_26037:798-1496(+)
MHRLDHPAVRSTAPQDSVAAQACRRAGHGGSGNCCQEAPASSLRQTSAKQMRSHSPSWLPSSASSKLMASPAISKTLPFASTAVEAWHRGGHGGGGSCSHVSPPSSVRQVSARPPSSVSPPRTRTAPPGKDAEHIWRRGCHGAVGSSRHDAPASSLRQISLRQVSAMLSPCLDGDLPPRTRTASSGSVSTQGQERADQGGVGFGAQPITLMARAAEMARLEQASSDERKQPT